MSGASPYSRPNASFEFEDPYGGTRPQNRKDFLSFSINCLVEESLHVNDNRTTIDTRFIA